VWADTFGSAQTALIATSETEWAGDRCPNGSHILGMFLATDCTSTSQREAENDE
jgi:hypothetical protein